MKPKSQSDIFKINQFFWQIFGLWPGKIPIKYYKYFSLLFVTSTTVIYNIFLVVNLMYTPRNIENLIEEVTFFFTEVAVLSKVAMLLLMRDKIANILKLVDCEEFQSEDKIGRDVIYKNDSKYKSCWKVYAAISNFSFFNFIVLPVILHLTWQKDLELPIAKYYFMSDEMKEKYFTIWFVFQSIGIYVHMTYNINVDSFIAGLILIGISQLKVLNHNFLQLKLDSTVNLRDVRLQTKKLNQLLRHYDLIVKFCYDVQDVISFVMFVQFCMASAIICVSMLGLLMVSTSVLYGMISYLSVMTLQIFVPGWLGTLLSYESQELAQAAYFSNWIPQTTSYKRSILLFIGRVNTPIVIRGLKVFPLSLGTFISIMKMAYSFFALLRKLQDRDM